MSARLPVAPEDCPDPETHGNPFRYCPYCTWIDPDTPPSLRARVQTIVDEHNDASPAMLILAALRKALDESPR